MPDILNLKNYYCLSFQFNNFYSSNLLCGSSNNEVSQVEMRTVEDSVYQYSSYYNNYAILSHVIIMYFFCTQTVVLTPFNSQYNKARYTVYSKKRFNTGL